MMMVRHGDGWKRWPAYMRDVIDVPERATDSKSDWRVSG
jgi:hypothetical protein